MAQIAILERKCTGCGLCAGSCPFGAIDMKDGKPELNAACRVCGLCAKVCPEKAVVKLETRVASVDKTQWRDILVFAEVSGGRLHPVSLELIGKARELAGSVPGFTVKAVLLGEGVAAHAEELRHYGVAEVAVELQAKKATVTLVKEVSDKALADAVTEAGYTATGCVTEK